MKLNHLAIPYLALLAIIFGGILTSGGIAWYHTLTVPSWHPSEAVIALVWVLIYSAGAWSVLMVWNRLTHDARFRFLMTGYVLCLLLNLLWSVTFFTLHLLALSVGVALVLGVVGLGLIRMLYPRSTHAALLMVPYVAWVLYATYLTYIVFTLNG